jgi:putative OPT family oligopeptide transporter
VIFTIPALVLLQHWAGFHYGYTMMIAMAGGVLGVMFTVPLRRALIIEANLQFPEGVATGEVLKAGTEGGKGAKLIAIAAIAGGLLKLSQTGLKLVAGTASGSVTVGRGLFGMGSELGVALLGVGYIVGLNIAVLVFGGGLISWAFGIPLFTMLNSPERIQAIAGDAQGYDLALTIWSRQIRYMGVGAMATGGLWALIALMKPIRDGIRSSLETLRAAKTGQATDVPRTERDTPLNVLLILAGVMALPIFFVMMQVIDQAALGISGGLYWTTILVSLVFAYIAGFLFSAVAGYMAGLVGSSNNPISGVTIATVLSISFILLFLLRGQIDFGVDTARSTLAAATAILVGAVVCCAAAIAGDNLQDLKAGRIVGATPWKQQTMQIVGVVAGALAIPLVLSLLYNAYGMGGMFPREGMDPSEALQAPQATLMASVANGVFARNLPWTMIYIGIAIAVAIIALDQVLKARRSSFRTPVLAVAVGIYLPIELSTPIFIGGVVAWLAERTLRARGADQARIETGGRNGLLFASGLITGEALVGIMLAIPFAAAQSTDVLRLAPVEGFTTIAMGLGLVLFGVFTWWTYRVAARE